MCENKIDLRVCDPCEHKYTTPISHDDTLLPATLGAYLLTFIKRRHINAQDPLKILQRGARQTAPSTRPLTSTRSYLLIPLLRTPLATKTAHILFAWPSPVLPHPICCIVRHRCCQPASACRANQYTQRRYVIGIISPRRWHCSATAAAPTGLRSRPPACRAWYGAPGSSSPDHPRWR